MNNPTVTQNNDIETLKLVEKFGFKFFGYDENALTLVVAPNGQIVQLNIAYEFVKTQIANSQVSSNGPEGMPNMPIMSSVPESNFESNLEKETTLEKPIEKKAEVAQQQVQVSAPVTSQPVVQKAKEPDSPYGDGFRTPINPVYIDKAMEYIKRNSRKSLSSTSRWLSVQFDKFVNEQKASK